MVAQRFCFSPPRSFHRVFATRPAVLNPRTIKRIRQMTEALDIRVTGASFAHVGKSLNPPVSRQRAWKIVTTAIREAEAAEQKLKREGLAHFRLLTVYRLERQIRALDAKLPDVNAARMLLKISTMVSRLNGLE